MCISIFTYFFSLCIFRVYNMTFEEIMNEEILSTLMQINTTMATWLSSLWGKMSYIVLITTALQCSLKLGSMMLPFCMPYSSFSYSDSFVVPYEFYMFPFLFLCKTLLYWWEDWVYCFCVCMDSWLYHFLYFIYIRCVLWDFQCSFYFLGYIYSWVILWSC